MKELKNIRKTDLIHAFEGTKKQFVLGTFSALQEDCHICNLFYTTEEQDKYYSFARDCCVKCVLSDALISLPCVLFPGYPDFNESINDYNITPLNIQAVNTIIKTLKAIPAADIKKVFWCASQGDFTGVRAINEALRNAIINKNQTK